MLGKKRLRTAPLSEIRALKVSDCDFEVDVLRLEDGYTTPADLLIVQHHTKVAPEVRNLMSAIARSSGKHWSVIDGADTAAILRVYKKLPRKPRGKASRS